MTLEHLAERALKAIRDGGDMMTLTVPKGAKMPRGFPRGRMLCEYGRVFAYDPRAILAWLDSIGCCALVGYAPPEGGPSHEQ